MCGIAGSLVTSKVNRKIDVDALVQSRDLMAVRGPDDKGLYISPNECVGLAHRRLSIIDTSSLGHQPMASSNDRLIVSFNGEIYNYLELKKDLQNQGVQFRTGSDTELLLHLYQLHGREMLNYLRGMFAFAIWDVEKQALFIATDPFGIKPLYYSWDGSSLHFASQVKALFPHKNIDTSPNPAGHVGFLLLGSVPEPHTLYKGIKAIGAGSYIWADLEGTFEHGKWLSMEREIAKLGQQQNKLTQKESQELFRESLLDSVKCHLLSDVPVTVFLSSGLDSTTLASLAVEASAGPVNTVTLAFEEFKGKDLDEAPLAEKFAAELGTKHSTIYISIEDFQSSFDNILANMDQPSIDGINTYFVSLAAARSGAVVGLSGLGGDELLGGYPSFHQIPGLINKIGRVPFRNALGRAFTTLAAPIAKRSSKPKSAGLLQYGGDLASAYLLRRALYMPWELTDILDADFAAQGLKELNLIPEMNSTIHGNSNQFLEISALETSWYMRNQLLRDSDWAGMAHSIEIRVPFVDINLWRSVLPLMGSAQGPMLSKQDLGAVTRPALPEFISNRAKTGFAIPLKNWLATTVLKDSDQPELRAWGRYLYDHRDVQQDGTNRSLATTRRSPFTDSRLVC